MSWKFGAASDIGGRREQQDRFALLHSKDGRRHLIVLADGMGGMQKGAEAAQILVDVARQCFEKYKNGEPFGFLQGICLDAHHAINGLKAGKETAPGTTALLLFIDKQHAYWAHAGDSRLYHFHNGRLIKHTHDHSLLQLMLDQDLIEAGSDAAAGAQNQLYMHLGGDKIPEPDFNEAEINDGDLFVLCSDGFWQAVRPDEMISALEHDAEIEESAKKLADLARHRGGDGSDNITLAVSKWNGTQEKGGLYRIADIFLRYCHFGRRD